MFARMRLPLRRTYPNLRLRTLPFRNGNSRFDLRTVVHLEARLTSQVSMHPALAPCTALRLRCAAFVSPGIHGSRNLPHMHWTDLCVRHVQVTTALDAVCPY